ncbi:hypothetical protein Ancab_039675 [Ancistrocladus abbreviatus]
MGDIKTAYSILSIYGIPFYLHMTCIISNIPAYSYLCQVSTLQIALPPGILLSSLSCSKTPLVKHYPLSKQLKASDFQLSIKHCPFLNKHFRAKQPTRENSRGLLQRTIIMATPDVLQREEDLFVHSSIFDPHKGETVKSRGVLIEKKIEFLESLTSKVSNRRSRRLLNDRLLMELVPRLSAEEIRGLFAPPPWGDDVPVSPFCMTNVGEWDKFRNIDMDKEASIMKAIDHSLPKRKAHIDSDKKAVLNAWHRVDSRTREALRQSFLSELIQGYENSVRAFIEEGQDADFIVLHVQDPFRRLLLHGVCEFYNLASVTETESKGPETVKMTKIRKKKSASPEIPNITLSHFLKMLKEGSW